MEEDEENLKKGSNVCIHCDFDVETKEELVEHITNSDDCLNHYGIKGLEKLKDEGQKVIQVKYLKDDNTACAPLIEDGCSKLDHSRPEKIHTLPSNTTLCPRFLGLNYSDPVDSFVGMTLSPDGESIEVRTLINEETKSDLGNLMNLFHAIMAVMDSDLCTLCIFKMTPFVLNNTGLNMQCLRNKFTNELVESDGKMPDPPETTCIPDKTRETHFLSERMSLIIPYQQLLSNANLAFRDMAAIGAKLKRNGKLEIRPLFSVNMIDDWRPSMKIVGLILSTWFGSKEALNDHFCKLPCYISACNRFIHETYIDCMENLKKPPIRVNCKHCGLEFRYNSYLFREKTRFKHHESSHDLVCKHCGLQLENHTLKIYHLRTHKPVHYKCEQCPFVGSSTRSMESHIKFKHTEAVCELCGKAVSCGATLDMHKREVHKLKIRRADDGAKFFCHICGKPYCNKQVLKKHIRCHSNEDSIVNKKMLEDPTEYKYMCTRHNNCRKYFKQARYLKRHVQLYGDKPYPHSFQDLPVPSFPEGHVFITDQDKELWESAAREEKAKEKFEEIQRTAKSAKSREVVIPKTQGGQGAFPCHLCSKSYEKKATLEKHLASHAKADSTVNRILKEDPLEYKYMCTRHSNCKKYFKKARYLRNHLYKFANIPYPENAGAHYMPDIRPDQKFITDQDPELFDCLNQEEKERRAELKDKRDNATYPMTEEQKKEFFMSD